MSNLALVREELHCSASSIRCLEACSRRYWLQYGLGLPPQDRSARMVLGSATHRALAAFYRQLRDEGTEPGLPELMGITGSHIARAALDDPPLLYAEGEDASTLVQTAERLLTAFLEQGLRPAKVMAVEEPFSLPLPGYDEVVVGFFDLVAEDDQGRLLVADHKTTSRLDKTKSSRLDAQQGLYCWAARQIWKREPVLLYQDLISTKQARVVTQEVARQPGDVEEVLEAAAGALELIHVAVAHPRPMTLMARRRSWMCPGCGYRDACQGVGS